MLVVRQIESNGIFEGFALKYSIKIMLTEHSLVEFSPHRNFGWSALSGGCVEFVITQVNDRAMID